MPQGNTAVRSRPEKFGAGAPSPPDSHALRHEPFRKEVLSSWGLFSRALSHVRRPETERQLEKMLAEPSSSSMIARGAGLSYGDAPLCPSGVTYLTERLNCITRFDRDRGIISCQAGTTIRDILDVSLRHGWFPSFTPGTASVTIGGALAADVHGKSNLFLDSFGHHVEEFGLRLASGEELRCSRLHNAELFKATVGGMGLTGIVTDVVFRLSRLEKPFLKLTRKACFTPFETIDCLEKEHMDEHGYSVAWLDLRPAKSAGRGVVLSARPATESCLESPPEKRTLSLTPFLSSPFAASQFLRQSAVGLINEFYFRSSVHSRDCPVVPMDSFFYPLDQVRNWNLFYGKNGFLQYQFVVPDQTSREAISEIIHLLAKSQISPYLVVLKKTGMQSGFLSFCMPGTTMALDFPYSAETLLLFDRFDRCVIRNGGRVYLAKDARLSAEAFRSMYEGFAGFLAVKKEFDPDNRFQSALSRRLRLFE